MPYVEMICMANSRKLNGSCVAGLRTDGLGWIRPVADSEDGTLCTFLYRLDGGGAAKPLDIIRVPMKAPRPEKHQPENWVIGDSEWKYVGQANRSVASLLKKHLLTERFLFGDASDYVPFSLFEAHPAKASLALIAPQDLKWRIDKGAYGKRKTRAVFRYRTTVYDLAVTDPAWVNLLTNLEYDIGNEYPSHLAKKGRILLTISLGEPYGAYNRCYKLVAGVIVIPREWGVTFEQK